MKAQMDDQKRSNYDELRQLTAVCSECGCTFGVGGSLL